MSEISMRAVPPFVAALPDATLVSRQQPRPGALRIALVNLMPTKEVTERQWLRLLAQTDLDGPMHVELFRLTHWTPRHTPASHMATYYRPLNELMDNPNATADYDAVIVTGAPLGQVRYQDVKYWREVTDCFDFLSAHAIPTLFSCWAAQAALFHLYGVPTLRCPAKLSGVFTQQLNPLLGTCDITFKLHQAVARLTTPLHMPLSRFALPDPVTLQRLLDDSQQALHSVLRSETEEDTLLFDADKRNLFILGHPEYEADTLALEYQRDRERQADFPAPLNYAADQSEQNHEKSAEWQALGALLIKQWLSRS